MSILVGEEKPTYEQAPYILGGRCWGQVLRSNISRIGEPDHASFSARLELGELTRFQRLPCYPAQAKLLDLARFRGLFTPIGS